MFSGGPRSHRKSHQSSNEKSQRNNSGQKVTCRQLPQVKLAKADNGGFISPAGGSLSPITKTLSMQGFYAHDNSLSKLMKCRGDHGEMEVNEDGRGGKGEAEGEGHDEQGDRGTSLWLQDSSLGGFFPGSQVSVSKSIAYESPANSLWRTTDAQTAASLAEWVHPEGHPATSDSLCLPEQAPNSCHYKSAAACTGESDADQAWRQAESAGVMKRRGGEHEGGEEGMDYGIGVREKQMSSDRCSEAVAHKYEKGDKRERDDLAQQDGMPDRWRPVSGPLGGKATGSGRVRKWGRGGYRYAHKMEECWETSSEGRLPGGISVSGVPVDTCGGSDLAKEKPMGRFFRMLLEEERPTCEHPPVPSTLPPRGPGSAAEAAGMTGALQGDSCALGDGLPDMPPDSQPAVVVTDGLIVTLTGGARQSSTFGSPFGGVPTLLALEVVTGGMFEADNTLPPPSLASSPVAIQSEKSTEKVQQRELPPGRKLARSEGALRKTGGAGSWRQSFTLTTTELCSWGSTQQRAPKQRRVKEVQLEVSAGQYGSTAGNQASSSPVRRHSCPREPQELGWGFDAHAHVQDENCMPGWEEHPPRQDDKWQQKTEEAVPGEVHVSGSRRSWQDTFVQRSPLIELRENATWPSESTLPSPSSPPPGTPPPCQVSDEIERNSPPETQPAATAAAANPLEVQLALVSEQGEVRGQECVAPSGKEISAGATAGIGEAAAAAGGSQPANEVGPPGVPSTTIPDSACASAGEDVGGEGDVGRGGGEGGEDICEGAEWTRPTGIFSDTGAAASTSASWHSASPRPGGTDQTAAASAPEAAAAVSPQEATDILSAILPDECEDGRNGRGGGGGEGAVGREGRGGGGRGGGSLGEGKCGDEIAELMQILCDVEEDGSPSSASWHSAPGPVPGGSCMGDVLYGKVADKCEAVNGSTTGQLAVPPGNADGLQPLLRVERTLSEEESRCQVARADGGTLAAPPAQEPEPAQEVERNSESPCGEDAAAQGEACHVASSEVALPDATHEKVLRVAACEVALPAPALEETCQVAASEVEEVDMPPSAAAGLSPGEASQVAAPDVASTDSGGEATAAQAVPASASGAVTQLPPATEAAAAQQAIDRWQDPVAPLAGLLSPLTSVRKRMRNLIHQLPQRCHEPPVCATCRPASSRHASPQRDPPTGGSANPAESNPSLASWQHPSGQARDGGPPPSGGGDTWQGLPRQSSGGPDEVRAVDANRERHVARCQQPGNFEGGISSSSSIRGGAAGGGSPLNRQDVCHMAERGSRADLVAEIESLRAEREREREERARDRCTILELRAGEQRWRADGMAWYKQAVRLEEKVQLLESLLLRFH